jgi:uncharacterized heparinase superfamily protein
MSTSTRYISADNWSFTSRALLNDRIWIKFYVHHWALSLYYFHWLYTFKSVRWSPPGLKNAFLALSAWIFFYLGLKNTAFPTESIEQIVIIWSIHLYF